MPTFVEACRDKNAPGVNKFNIEGNGSALVTLKPTTSISACARLLVDKRASIHAAPSDGRRKPGLKKLCSGRNGLRFASASASRGRPECIRPHDKGLELVQLTARTTEGNPSIAHVVTRGGIPILAPLNNGGADLGYARLCDASVAFDFAAFIASKSTPRDAQIKTVAEKSSRNQECEKANAAVQEGFKAIRDRTAQAMPLASGEDFIHKQPCNDGMLPSCT